MASTQTASPVRPAGASSSARAWYRLGAALIVLGAKGGLDVAVVSLVFAVLFIWYSRNIGQPWWIYWAPFIMAGAALVLGIPIYRSQRRRMTDPQHPATVP
jgi:hypothetical protein